MSIKPTLIKALGLGLVVTVVSAGSAFAAVATGNVNVRSGPSPSYRVVDRLFPGEVVAITDRAGSWCEVSKPGPDGWVACSYLSQSRVIDRPRYGYGRYDRAPSFSFSFGTGGFGQYPRDHHDDHNDHNDHHNNTGGMFSIN